MDDTPDPADRQPFLSDAHRGELAASAISADGQRPVGHREGSGRLPLGRRTRMIPVQRNLV